MRARPRAFHEILSPFSIQHQLWFSQWSFPNSILRWYRNVSRQGNSGWADERLARNGNTKTKVIDSQNKAWEEGFSNEEDIWRNESNKHPNCNISFKKPRKQREKETKKLAQETKREERRFSTRTRRPHKHQPGLTGGILNAEKNYRSYFSDDLYAFYCVF